MTDVMVELRALNPAPADAEPHPTAWSDSALLAEIDTRSGTDMSLDQKPKTERAKRIESPQRWTRGLVAAAAFVAVIGVIGVIAFVDFGSSGTTVPPATTEVTSTTVASSSAPTTSVTPSTAAPSPVPESDSLDEDQIAFVAAFLDAWNNDVDAYLDLLAANARVETIRSAKYDIMVDSRTPIDREKFEAMSHWDAAIGTQTTIDSDRCTYRSGIIACPFSMTDILIAGTVRAATGIVELIESDGEIHHLGFAWSAEFGYGGIVLEFEAWIVDNHPEVAEQVGMYELYTLDSAEVWQQYVPIYLENRFNS